MSNTVNLISRFKNSIQESVVRLLEQEFELSGIDAAQFKFETPPDEKMGHIAFACFPLAKLARKAPQQIAEILQEKWETDAFFQKIEATGPYLNFHINPDYLAKQLVSQCRDNDRYGENDAGLGKTIMVEYSSPNTNKPLHLGHGRNNLIGMTVANLLEKCAYQVVKANLVNDRGVHICKSMLAYQNWGEGKTPEDRQVRGDQFVGDFYVLYDQKSKENPDLDEQVQKMLLAWESGEAETVSLWRKMNDWVLSGFRQTYQRMGTHFDRYYYESETYTGGKELIQAALENGVCYQEENGAIAIDLEDEKLGRKILLRGDGTAVYMTQDINTTVTKFNDYDLDGCLFVVANEQDNHFRVLFTVLKKFGYDWADRCEHASYGMITLPEGKMKSREGTVVDLEDLMNEMQQMALAELKKREAVNADRTEAELLEVAEAIGLAAIKFFILKTNAQKEISFNPKESLSFDGATGPYLQYTHARISSIFRKASTPWDSEYAGDHDWNSDEINLMIQLARFPDVIQQCAMDRNPAMLCGFVYELCRLFNKFYYEHSILKGDTESVIKARLQLCAAVKAVLKKNLDLLGIVALEKM
jgi:arginyl-tRNA synthetase